MKININTLNDSIKVLYTGEYGDEFFTRNGDELIFPKFNNNNLPTILESSYYKRYKKELSRKRTSKIKLKYPPKEEQLEAIKFIDNSAQEDILVSASTGFGKTYCAINHISKSDNTYMIICDRTTLIDQWVRAILEFTDIKEEEIGIIQQKYLTKKNIQRYKDICKIFIVSIKTAGSRLLSEPKRTEFTDMLIKDFKITGIISDEAHLKLYNLFLITTCIPVNKTIFLTATPSRTFETENRVLSEILPLKNTYEYKETEVYVNHIFFTIDSCLTNGQKNFISAVPPDLRFMPYNKNAYMRILYSNDKFPFIYRSYISRVLDMAEDAIGKENLNIMIAIENIAPLEKLKRVITERYANKKLILYYGKNKDSIEIDKNEDNFVILATTKNISAGFDMVNTNLLLNLDVTSNKTNIEQLVGRLRRKGNCLSKQKFYVTFRDIAHKKINRTTELQIDNIRTKLMKNEDTITEVSLLQK